MDAGLRTGDLQPGVVPLHQELRPLRLAQQGEIRQAAVGVRRGAREQMAAVEGQALHGRAVEQVGAVLDPAVDPPAPGLFEEERQVELHRAGERIGRPQRQAGQRELRQRLAQREQDLKQRAAGEIPLRLQGLDELLERQLGVRQSAQRRFAAAQQKSAERRVAGQVAAQHQEVEEEADHPLQRRIGAVRHRGADRDVVLPGMARENRLEHRQDRHEEGGAGRAAETPHRVHRRGVEAHRAARAARAPDRRPRAVRGELQGGRTRSQALAPVAQQLLQAVAAQTLALPDGVVGVVHGELRQGRRPGLDAGRVELPQLADEQAERPGVGGDVMDGQEQPVALRPAAQQDGVQQGAAREIEGAGGLRGGPAGQLSLLRRRREGAQVDARHEGDRGELRRRERDLERLAPGEDEAGAQPLMTAQDLAEAPGERRRIEAPLAVERRRQVQVRGAGLDPLQEPEPLLREGQRQRLLPR